MVLTTCNHRIKQDLHIQMISAQPKAPKATNIPRTIIGLNTRSNLIPYGVWKQKSHLETNSNHCSVAPLGNLYLSVLPPNYASHSPQSPLNHIVSLSSLYHSDVTHFLQIPPYITSLKINLVPHLPLTTLPPSDATHFLPT